MRRRVYNGVILTRRFVAESIREGFAPKPKLAINEHAQGEERNCPPGRHPCASPKVDSYLTLLSEEEKQVKIPVNQAAPMLEHTLPHGHAERHEVAGARSYVVGGAYLSYERYCPVCPGLFLDGHEILRFIYSGVANSESPRVLALDVKFSDWYDVPCF